jgi:hypothetical protein
MTCDDVELELSGGSSSPDVRAHLETCASCQTTARVLGLATLPPLTDTERLVLSGLAASTQREWRAHQRPRRSFAARLASLALAAGVGALLASTIALRSRPEPTVETRTVLMAPAEVPEFSDLGGADFNLSDDDVFFEVGWPSPTEGDL